MAQPIDLNVKGDKHANQNGRYLGAAVFYEMIFRENVEANSFVPADVSAEDAKVLRHVAHETVTEAAMQPKKKP